MSQKDADKLMDSVNEYISKGQEAAASAGNAADETLSKLSSGVRQGGAFVINQTNDLRTRLEDIQETGSAHMAASEEQVLSVARENIKQSMLWFQAYPYAAYGMMAGTLLLFPQPRAFVWRRVFGVFQSQESMFRGASSQAEALRETSTELLSQHDKLSAAATQALQDLAVATSQASTAKKELEGLSSSMASACTKYEGVRDTLRGLKSPEVMELQTEVARDLKELSSQHRKISSLVSQMTSKGL